MAGGGALLFELLFWLAFLFDESALLAAFAGGTLLDGGWVWFCFSGSLGYSAYIMGILSSEK